MVQVLRSSIVGTLVSRFISWRRYRSRMDVHRRYRGFEIGRHSYGRPKIHFANSGAQLRVGQFCSFANDVEIFLGGEHRTDWVSTYPFSAMFRNAGHIHGHPATKGDVVIGNDVWLGHGVTILSGVRIGDGAVIGARSVVAKDVAPYAIVSGNPAKFRRYRFTEEQIEKLLQIAWWNWSLEKISAEIPALLSGDVGAFIARHMERSAADAG